MSTFEITEKSSFCLPVTLTDRNGDPLSPIDSISWWVGKPKSALPIIEKQELETLEAEFELTIPAEANICSGTKDEKRFVMIRAASGDHVKHMAFEYTIEAYYTVPYPAEV